MTAPDIIAVRNLADQVFEQAAIANQRRQAVENEIRGWFRECVTWDVWQGRLHLIESLEIAAAHPQYTAGNVIAFRISAQVDVDIDGTVRATILKNEEDGIAMETLRASRPTPIETVVAKLIRTMVDVIATELGLLQRG